MTARSKPSNPRSGGGGTPCNGNVTPCPASMVHARLQVKEITFSGNHTVNQDTLGNFTAPEWVRGRAASANSPVCYTRNNRVTLTAKFEVTRRPSAAETVQVRGRSTLGATALEWTGSTTVSPGDAEVTVSGMTSNVNLPNAVACYDPVTPTWEANPANTNWASAGSSSHTVYVVLGNPSGTPAYWTLLDISCRAAHGQTTSGGVLTRAYSRFQTRSLTRKRDGQGLTYWNPSTTTCTNTQQLLASSDGSGQCGSWSEFLIDMLKCHGITNADKILVVRTVSAWRSSSEGFLVKNWTFTGSGSHSAPWTHRLGTECVEQPGVPGQRNANPPPAFYNHFIVRHGGNFYDPSYGSASVSTKGTWENGAIDGLFRGNRAGYPKSAHSTTNLLEFWDLTTNSRI